MEEMPASSACAWFSRLLCCSRAHQRLQRIRIPRPPAPPTTTTTYHARTHPSSWRPLLPRPPDERPQQQQHRGGARRRKKSFRFEKSGTARRAPACCPALPAMDLTKPLVEWLAAHCLSAALQELNEMGVSSLPDFQDFTAVLAEGMTSLLPIQRNKLLREAQALFAKAAPLQPPPLQQQPLQQQPQPLQQQPQPPPVQQQQPPPRPLPPVLTAAKSLPDSRQERRGVRESEEACVVRLARAILAQRLQAGETLDGIAVVDQQDAVKSVVASFNPPLDEQVGKALRLRAQEALKKSLERVRTFETVFPPSLRPRPCARTSAP